MRVPFGNIFVEHPDGSLEPRRQININGVVFGPGVRIGQGVAFGGVNLQLYRGLDLEIEDNGPLAVVRGFYNRV